MYFIRKTTELGQQSWLHWTDITARLTLRALCQLKAKCLKTQYAEMAETVEMHKRMSKPWLLTSCGDSRDEAEAGDIGWDSCQAAPTWAAHLQLWAGLWPRPARTWRATYEFSTRSVISKWDGHNSSLGHSAFWASWNAPYEPGADSSGRVVPCWFLFSQTRNISLAWAL